MVFQYCKRYNSFINIIIVVKWFVKVTLFWSPYIGSNFYFVDWTDVGGVGKG